MCAVGGGHLLAIHKELAPLQNYEKIVNTSKLDQAVKRFHNRCEQKLLINRDLYLCTIPDDNTFDTMHWLVREDMYHTLIRYMGRISDPTLSYAKVQPVFEQKGKRLIFGKYLKKLFKDGSSLDIHKISIAMKSISDN